MILILISLAVVATHHLVHWTSIDVWFQQTCVSSLGNSSNIYYHALICGNRLSSASAMTWFKNWGFLHILVVSGAHFVFLEHHLQKIFHKLKLSPLLCFPPLLIFSFATGLGPPVLRSALSLMLQIFNKNFRYNWSHAQISLLSGLTCLFYVPSDQYLSLQLSWCAALLMAWPCASSFLQIRKMALIWLGLLPLLAGLNWSNPITIFANALLLPTFQVLVFPLVWIDQTLFLGLLKISSFCLPAQWLWSPSSYSSASMEPQFKWLYLLAVQVLSLTYKRSPNENSAVLPRFTFSEFSKYR